MPWSRACPAASRTCSTKPRPSRDPKSADAAIFYSISNTQEGLRGISFGNFLIKRVVDSLAAELPQLKAYATLSPMSGFRTWLDEQLVTSGSDLLSKDEWTRITEAAESEENPPQVLATCLGKRTWPDDEKTAEALRQPLLRLAAQYLTTQRETGRVLDRVGHFHLSNGARIERINWQGDTSAKGLDRAAGIMVNYLYDRDQIEDNHEAYARDGTVAVSSDVRSLATSRPVNGAGGQAKLRTRSRSTLLKMVGSG